MYNANNTLKDLINVRDRGIYETVNNLIISGPISCFGVLTNIINIIVFYNQGFNSTVNISFFGLAISDLCSLLTVICFVICQNPLLVYSDVKIWPDEIMYLTAGLPHICFARIGGFITVFITAERCLCITLPLKINQIVTPRRTMVTISLIYILIMTCFGPEYVTTYYDWKFFEHRNRTLLGFYFTSYHEKVEGFVFFMYSLLGFGSFVAVITFTVILVIQLSRKSKWRMQAVADGSQSEGMSRRESKTMAMVVMIATVLIVCYTPGVIVSMITFFESEFSILGRFVNIYFVMWSFVFIFETLNASINIFFYYKMSIKYRETFHKVFGWWCIKSNDE